MEKSSGEVLNLWKYTHTDIFGDDDTNHTSGEDEEERTVETGTDGKRRKLQRVRLTEQEKIEIAQYSQKNPLLNQRELIEC
jgi:hypothetical protein